MKKSKSVMGIFSVIFFITGFVSLTYQLAWNKLLSQTIGPDHFSNTLIIAIFMLGIGTGGCLGSVVTKRFTSPILFF